MLVLCGLALESVVARVCREAGGRVATNVMLRDLDMALPNVADGRRLEVVADGLPLFGGVSLPSTPLLCALRRDGNPSRRKERTYPELELMSRQVGRSCCGHREMV